MARRTLYGNVKLKGGTSVGKPSEMEDKDHYIDTTNRVFIYKYNGIEYAIGGGSAIVDVNASYSENVFTINSSVDITKDIISLRFKAPAELVLTDSPTIKINNLVYTIESGYFKEGDIVIANLDNEARKCFFRNADREEVINVINFKASADDSQVKLSWDVDKTENLQGFILCYGTHIPSDMNDGTRIILSRNAREITIDNLENDTIYHFVIQPYTKRQYQSETFRASGTPFAGVMLSDLEVGSIVYLDSRKDTSFIVVDKNHYSKNEVNLIYYTPITIGSNANKSPYGYTDGTWIDFMSDAVVSLTERGLNLIPIDIWYYTTPSTTQSFRLTQGTHTIFLPSMTELGGTDANPSKDKDSNFELFNASGISLPNTNETLKAKRKFMEYSYTRSKSSLSKGSSSLYCCTINGRVENAVSTGELPKVVNIHPVINLSSEQLLAVDENGDYILKTITN